MSVLNIALLLVNVHLSHGGWPISDPNVPKGSGWPNVKQSAKYNLIDVDPSCFHEGVCNMFPPGKFMEYVSIFLRLLSFPLKIYGNEPFPVNSTETLLKF